jgi:predicted RND superfamily exporter protein
VQPQTARRLGVVRRLVVVAVVLVATAGSAMAVALGLHLDPNVASLLPESGESVAFGRYLRAFGGGDLAVVMVKGDDPEETANAAHEIATRLAESRSVTFAADRIVVPPQLEPMLAFRYADTVGLERLREALSPEGMRTRLRESRALLLAPGSGALASLLARDPLRLGALALGRIGLGAGMRTQADGTFATDDGTMRLVLARPAGQALRGEDARRFTREVTSALSLAHQTYPRVRFGFTGGHAIAAATEAMLQRDLTLSGILSMVLASTVFVAIFRRLRALVAVMPPLVLGTLWTAGIAAALPGGLSAVAVAFTSVVVGVGVDTGVHVYAALLDARRAGLSPARAAQAARAKTGRAVMMAAVTAAAAFLALGLSGINAVRQLGVLCGAGEILTAVAILLVTPELGAWLERGPPPPPPPAAWTRVVALLTATRARASAMIALAIAPIALILVVGPPPLAEALVAIRPRKLVPLAVQTEVLNAFGGRRGQIIVLLHDRDLERAYERADTLYEGLLGLRGLVESVDAASAVAPSVATQRARYAARDALDLPAKADELTRALAETGFSPERFRHALDDMRQPTHEIVPRADATAGLSSLLLGRYLGRDGPDHVIAMYVLPSPGVDVGATLRARIHGIDPEASITGYQSLEASLRGTLAHDLPRICAVSAVLVVLALAASLRRPREVFLAGLVVASEIATVLIVVRLVGIPLHAYSALVIPVLLGITVDEGMFLLHHAREVNEAHGGAERDAIAQTLRTEGPPVAATALTTAAGFAALGVCEFDGLRDLGWVGALGSAVGLIVALLVVPAGLRVFRAPKKEPT